MSMTPPSIAILGAGPVGLEAAAAALETGHPFTIYERAATIAGNLRDWGHVRMFSPWSLNVSPRLRRLLAAQGVEPPDGDACPTGVEFLQRALEPVAAAPEIEAHLELGVRVRAVSRQGMVKSDGIGDPERGRRPFRILLEDREGAERLATADVVLDCTGNYGNPNALGDGGIPAPGERSLADSIRRTLPDLGREAEEWAGHSILLVGSGHSGQTAARDLAELAAARPGTRVIWALRAEEPSFVPVADDPLPERARLNLRAGEIAGGAEPAIETRAGVVVESLAATDGGVAATLRRSDGTAETVEVDRILSLTGYVGDHTLYRQLQVHECYATCGPMKLAAALLGESSADCLDQESHGAETLTNPEPRFFILGAKSYGRHSHFLMRVGWSQVDEVFGLLIGD